MTSYTVIERSRTITAPADSILARIVNYHDWVDWSPWEGLDPDLQRTYTGPDSGVGTAYEWSGNKKAGAGRMEVTSVSDRLVEMDLTFTRPFKSASLTTFEMSPGQTAETTDVVWKVKTPKTLMTRIAGVFMNFDKTVGADLDKGLTQLDELSRKK